MREASLQQRLEQARVVPVIRASDADVAHGLVERLCAAGLELIELTCTIPRWGELAAAVRAERPELCLGVGTVMSAAEAERAVAVGADFCVSPCLAPAVRPVLAAAGVAFVEGGLSPTEVLDAAGRGIAKLFPAHFGGVAYLRSLLAVAPQARIVPTGGIPLGEVGTWLAAGALAVGVGSDITTEGDVAERVAAALAS